MERIETDWKSGKTMEMPMAIETGDTAFLTRVEVYQNSRCLIDEEFRKKYISIGRNTNSDIVLPDVRISRNHVQLYIDNYQIFIFVLPRKQALSINGQPIRAALLGTDDTIELGPYTLKIRLRLDDNPPQFEDDLRYQVVFEGNIQEGFTRSRVANALTNLLNINDQRVASIFSGKFVVVKRDLNLTDAIQFKNKFEKSGAIGQIQAVINSVEPDEKSLDDISSKQWDDHPDESLKNIEPVEHPSRRTDQKLKTEKAAGHPSNRAGLESKNEEIEAQPSGQTQDKPKIGQSESHLASEGLSVPAVALPSIQPAAGDQYDDEDEDEDEDDSEASFSLKEILSTFAGESRRQPRLSPNSALSIGVFKFLKDAVVDVCYLNRKESYYIDSNRGRFRLVQKNGSDKGFLFFSENFTGTVNAKESGPVSISDFLTRDHLHHKRNRIYRLPLPDTGEVRVNDGCFDYLIRPVLPDKSPTVSAARQSKNISWKHGALSLLIHIACLAVLTLLPGPNPKNASEPETRFVKVDPHILNRIQPKPKPIVKPPTTIPQEIKPAAKPVQKKAAADKKPVVKKKSTKVAKKPTKAVSRKAASKSGNKSRKVSISKDPKAGGGHGKGNTANRNIKQVGLLGMLGNSNSAQVQPAMAEVTNLDAVRSSNSNQAKFKVGGIKGKLGTSEISVSGGEVVATKGNSQVLRSYGAEGSGHVAALQKGNVGQKQVKGMVQASSIKSVGIRGGMSREAVKRVIEQHLDEITYCYESALISNPSIKGKITMEWKIRLSGAVGEVRIKSSTVKSPEIYSCLKSAIKTWQFPKPVGNEVVVTYPFIFDIVGF